MNTLKTLLVASVATVGFAGVAYAADPILPVYDEPVYDAPSYDSGVDAYLGIYGGGVFGPDVYVLGLKAGVNFVLADPITGGIEVQGGIYTDGGDIDFEGFVLGKLGVAVTDDILVYGAGGVGYVEDFGPGVWAFGGGVEFAMTDSISLDGQILGVTPIGGGPIATRATIGLNFHF